VKEKSQQLVVPSLPRPIKPLRAGYSSLPKPPPSIPKPMDPKKTPKKEVRRELVSGYQSIGAFLSTVEYYTRQEFVGTTPGYRDIPDFQEFVAVDGIEVLRDIFNRLNTEFQDRNEIHWFLSSCWEGRFPELRIFLIACGIWKFILLHSEEPGEGNARVTDHQKAETRDTSLFQVLDHVNYMKLEVNGKVFEIGRSQGKAIKLLHERHVMGSPNVPDEDLKGVMGLPSTSIVKDSFKGRLSKPLWEALIVREGNALHLNI